MHAGPNRDPDVGSAEVGLKFVRNLSEKLINSCSEICGACRHKRKFHRYKEEVKTTSADDPEKGERVRCTRNLIDENDPTMNVVKDVPAGLDLPGTSSDVQVSQPSQQDSPKTPTEWEYV